MNPRILVPFCALVLVACGGKSSKRTASAPRPDSPGGSAHPLPGDRVAVIGRLTDQATNLGLPGVPVTAQKAGTFEVLDRALTDANGAYAFNRIPAGTPVRIVAQPVAGAVAYEAKASPVLTVAKKDPVPAVDLAFAAAAAAGNVEVHWPHRGGGPSRVALTRELAAPDGKSRVSVRTADRTAGGVVRFDTLPPGEYELHFIGSFGGPAPSVPPAGTRRPPMGKVPRPFAGSRTVTVKAGETTPVDLRGARAAMARAAAPGAEAGALAD